jgi:peptidoglycan/xylan/chitin deacetylase (PgdA/CDA1 family)
MIPLLATHVPRYLHRLFPDLLWRIPSDSRTLYFTFDDGPTPTLTGKILNVLDKYDAKASFFLIGQEASRHPDLVRAIQSAGHTIGNHTFSHPDAWHITKQSLATELKKTTEILEGLIQQPVRWMRPPYGRFTRHMRDWCQVEGQRLTMWDVMPGDYLPRITGSHVRTHVVRYARQGSIVVLHDNVKASDTPAALEYILNRLGSEGWNFDALL